MPQPSGYYLALDKKAVARLRSTKGDRARRAFVVDFIRTSPARTLCVDETHYLLEFVNRERDVPESLKWGKAMHKGQFYRLERLETAAVVAALAALPNDQAALAKQLRAMDEAKFRYHNVSFWVAEEWEKQGRKHVVLRDTPARAFAQLEDIRAFVGAVPSDHTLFFAISYYDGGVLVG
ncbi:MAG TPA: hypothetical protein VFV99_33755 [Kofleriaceae bacterium]|nr:hypothetical protein [Kofleriaceae bacterium]